MVRESRPYQVFGIFILLFISSANLFPMLNLFINSFRSNSSIVLHPLGLDGLLLDNYPKAQEFGNLALGMLNGCLISGFTIIVLLLSGSMSAFALTFVNVSNRFRRFLRSLIALGYFIPPAAVLISTFLTLRFFSLTNSYIGIVLVYSFLFTPITLIILSGYMERIPRTVVEAASIDGANPIVCYWFIITPMAKSALVTLVILLFLWTYNDFMWPLILMARPAKRTIAVSLTMFYDDRQQDFGLLAAGVSLSLIPIMTVYLVLKERIMSGMAAGALKD